MPVFIDSWEEIQPCLRKKAAASTSIQPRVTFRVGEALQGTVASVQEEKAQPAAGIKLLGIRLEHEERGFPSISSCDLRSCADISIKLIRGGGLSVTPCG